ncbi:MAG TPA: hypothetical protein VH593_12790 [Ktedonobacteraceae bacterium]
MSDDARINGTSSTAESIKSTAASAANKLGDAAKGLSEAVNTAVEGVTRPIDKIADALTKPANAIDKVAEAISSPFNVRAAMLGTLVFMLKGTLLAFAVLLMLRFTFVDLLPIYTEQSKEWRIENDKIRADKAKQEELKAQEREKMRQLELERYNKELEFKKFQLEFHKKAEARQAEQAKEAEQAAKKAETIWLAAKEAETIRLAAAAKQASIKEDREMKARAAELNRNIGRQLNVSYYNGGLMVVNSSDYDVDDVEIRTTVSKCYQLYGCFLVGHSDYFLGGIAAHGRSNGLTVQEMATQAGYGAQFTWGQPTLKAEARVTAYHVVENRSWAIQNGIYKP